MPGRVRRPTVIEPAAPSDDSAPPLLQPEQGGYEPYALAWESVSVLPDGHTLEIRATHGAGEQLQAVELDESDPQLIVVTLRMAFTQQPDGRPRTLVGYRFRAHGLLSRPLAGRMALDGALGSDDQLREEELEAAIRWRAKLGLPLERDLVERLVDDARMPDGRLHGSEVMSDEEQLWYRESLSDKEKAADFAKGWLAVADADLDGHGELTWHDGGAYVQYVVSSPAGAGDRDAAAELRAAADAAGIRRLTVVPVRYTYRELDAFHTRIREALDAAGIDVQRSGPDVSTNTVSVMVAGGLAQVEQARAAAADVAPLDAVSVVPLD